MIRTPYLPSVLGIILSLVLLAGSPVQAQQGSDVSGALPQSDISGALTQADAPVFEADVVQQRMSAAATALARALRKEAVAADGEGEAVSFSREPATVLVGEGPKEVEGARQQFVEVLSERGMPAGQAQSLGRAVSGLLSGGEVDPDQFVQSLHAYNAAVAAAPDEFQTDPPEEIVLVRTVLVTLVQAASV